MEDLHAAKGRHLGTVTFPVERGKLRELAFALHDEDPVWHDEAAARTAGFDGVPAPPTATVLAAHWTPGALIGRPLDLGLDVARLLHGEAAWSDLRPIRAGDSLTASAHVRDVTEREGRRGGTMLLVVIRTVFVDQRGEQVAVLDDTWVQTARPTAPRGPA
jgi:acyl dehydratase